MRNPKDTFLKLQKTMIFELTGLEGTEFEDLRVNRWGYGKKLIKYYGQLDDRKKKTIRFMVKVVGFKDDRAKERNWGLRP